MSIAENKNKVESVFDSIYSKESIYIAIFFTIFKKPKDLLYTEFRVFKNKVLQYQVQRRILYRRAINIYLQVCIIDNIDKRVQIIQSLYNKLGYQEIENIY